MALLDACSRVINRCKLIAAEGAKTTSAGLSLPGSIRSTGERNG